VRANILLLITSTLIGAVFALLVSPWVVELLSVRPEGSSFASLEEFREVASLRDTRDVLPDGSVTFRSIILPVEDDRIIYKLQPNLDVRFKRAQVQTNSYGFRDREWPVEKPEDEIRIALLGDSFAFGWGVAEDETFATQIEREFEARLAGKARVEVMNFGVPGYSTFQERAVFEERGITFNPDLVLVYFVDNDFSLPFFIRDAEAGASTLRNATNYVRQLWSSEAEENEKEYYRGLTKLADANQAVLGLARFLKERDIPFYLTINPNPRWKKHFKKLWALGHTEEGVQFLSLREPYEQVIKANGYRGRDLMLSWDPHPNPLRHKILGKLLADKLEPTVREIIAKAES